MDACSRHPPTPTGTHARTHARTHAHARTRTHLPKEAHEGGELVRHPQRVVGELGRELALGQHLLLLVCFDWIVGGREGLIRVCVAWPDPVVVGFGLWGGGFS